jgi:hypothetical protein
MTFSMQRHTIPFHLWYINSIVPDYPNIKIPSLTLETELGSIYKVKKVGFVLVDKSDCEIKNKYIKCTWR